MAPSVDLDAHRVPGKLVAVDLDHVFYWMWNQRWPGWDSDEWIEAVW